MTLSERAVALHVGGSACSQAVFSVFAERFGLQERLAHKVAAGLGGGIGRMGLTCGAVTGGVLALSLAYGNETGADQEGKLKTYDMTAELIAGMEKRHGSSQCKVLLGGADLWTQEGRDAVKAAGLSDRVCNKIIADVVEYVEQRLPEGKRHG